ncbi:MAG: TolB-like 6-bladed beta-propeller domain-containing protein [Bacteroidales bacterium]|nr:TolB-like 6-bladed beta-propeller domain-containing protein [Bacteroidales bacterium]
MLRRYSVANDTLKLKDAVIASGQGPLESLNIGQVFVNFPHRYLISYEANSRKTLRVNIGKDSMTVLPSNILEMDSLHLDHYCLIGDSVIVFTYCIPNLQYKSKAIIGMLDQRDNTFHAFEGYGLMPDKEYSFNEIAYYLNRIRIQSQPGGDKVFCYASVGLYGEIFNITNVLPTNRKVILNEFPDFEIGENMQAVSIPDDTKTGINRSYVTSKYIYLAPYRIPTAGERRAFGKARKEGNIPPEFDGPAKDVEWVETIWVFDWDGNPVRRLKVDRCLETFAVSEDDSVLYGTSVDDDYNPIIIRYQLK